MTVSGDAVAPVQVKDLVYRRLRDALIAHEFRPGESMRETALSVRFGVSKTPIREALVRLEHDGLVEIAPYRGARARAYSAEDARELYEARELLECECVRMAAGRPEVLDRLEANITQTAAALDQGDLDEAGTSLDAFDDLFFDLLDNALLRGVIERLALHLRRLGRLGAGPARFSDSLAQHRAILDALRDDDVVGAQEVLRAHLREVREVQIAALPAVDD
ncbi:GntR family transcriptional regulator [Nakamurella leprariae]|uniref:GntR family transcriptional regulator n=1 Tax=Nakamurella leprariae TaxID=2803911 RepID=A0A938YA41_9ACTN|nr:GntR family transcriptional regulator [Nakamurella leprariae]MBM9468690.1 GntR family transcriptional regulator [Nakamurella leprariae]